MKLHDAELVQWQDKDRAWQRGRLLRDSDGHPAARILAGLSGIGWLIRHGLSNDLEYVDATHLQVQEEEHPE
jgi:hypothetical protein